MVRLRYLLFISMFILFVNPVLADFNVGNASHSIKGVYGPSANIEGWVNISFTNQESNSLFSDTRGNSIELIDLLNKEGNKDYSRSCNPLSCSTAYTATGPETTKSFNMNIGDEKLYGLRLQGNVITINSVNFDLQSNAPVSCTSPIKVDFFDDGTIEFISNKSSSGTGCSSLKSYGCEITGTSEEFIINNVPYCQRIELSESPAFSVGAWVKKVSGSQNLKVSIYNNHSSVSVGSCQLPEPLSSGGEVSCDVNYSVTEQSDHFVCINSFGSGTGDYRIRGTSNQGNGCGFHRTPPTTNTPASYEIFAQGKSFDAPGTLQIANSLPSGNTLGSLTGEYITKTYGGFDCSSECVIPIKIISGVSQDITLKNLALNYEKIAGVVSESNFYDLEEVPAKISSGFGKMFLDGGGFSVPESKGNYSFSLRIDSQEAISEKVSVENVPQILSLKPSSTASAFPTEFTAKVNSTRNISKYFWDFGDGKVDTTLENKVTHTYSAIGSYNLKITVTDNGGFSSSRTFNISINSPKNLINSTLNETRKDISFLKTQISGFNAFTQKSIESAIKLNSTETEIERLEKLFNAAISDKEYELIITDLLKIDIPKSVRESSTAPSITFFPDFENIKPEVLEGITKESFDPKNSKGYSNGIASWHQENLEVKTNFKEISGEFKTSEEPLVRVFEMNIKEKKDLGHSYFLIMPKLINLEFEGNVLEKEVGNFVYIDLSEIKGTKKISFSTTEDVDFVDLPAFFSPGFSKLSILDSGPGDIKEEDSRLTIFILAIILLIVVAFIVYIILYSWYKKKYESYLFKNKNDLYNMVNYINNSKRKGLSNKDIAGNLKKARWSSEQIKYVMRKYSGKRTGMFELPITKAIGKIKKNDGK